jgi:hypothetical protein
LIESKNPANIKNEELKNFENSSIKSGGVTSHAGSVINHGSYNIFGALSSIGGGGGL